MITLFEWHSKALEVEKKTLNEFVSFLANVWQNRNKYIATDEEISEEELQEEKIQKQRFFDFTYDGKISARNYVGIVQFEGIRVEVFPKIFAGQIPVDKKRWQLNLLYWLSYCRKFKFPFSIAEVSKMDFDNYLELLIYIFANYTEEIISIQPFQSYQTVQEETSFLKGRLLFDEYIKKDLSTGKWQNFYCEYQPFIYDNLFNRIIKYVTRRLYTLSENILNKEKLNQILFILGEVSDEACISSDCDKVKLNPLFDGHNDILSLCRLFLSNQVIDMDEENSKNFCFLVPMEYVFEDFVYGFVSSNWPDLNLQSQSADYLATIDDAKVFKIKNDIYIKDKLIIDTKYKIRYFADDLKAGISQNDMYQMVSYAMRRNCKDVLLVYPESPNSLSTDATFKVGSKMLTSDLNINVKNLDITFENINDARSLIMSRIKLLDSIFD
jgi:5-methylcytosine-specific restriction enzyme subunit McrC